MVKKCGVYKIENIVNGKVYIGQSRNLKERYKSHLSSLRYKRHGNNHLQSAFNKYGENSFIYLVMEECEFDKIDEREIFWMGQYDANKMYNKKSGGSNGFTFSPSSIELMSRVRKGMVQSKETISRRVSKIRGQKRSEEFKKSQSERLKGIPQPKDRVEKMRITKTGVKLSDEQKLKLKGRGNKAITQFDTEGNFIRHFASAKEAGESLKIIKGDITQVCKGKRKTRGGFIFKYKTIQT